MAGAEARIDEAALIARCRRGDLTAFDILVSQSAVRIYNLTYRMLGCQHDAEDAAQEAFLRAFSALDKFRRGATFSTWVYRIAVNVCLDELRRRRGRPQPFSSLATSHDSADSGPAVDPVQFVPPGDDLGEIMERHTRRQEIEQALALLPHQQRAAVIMCDIEGMSYEEAAEAMGASVGTIKSRLHRARQRLRELLAPHGELLVE